MGDGMEPGQHDADQAEARRIAARKAVADRKAQAIRDERLVGMEEARQLARDMREAAFGPTTGDVGDIDNVVCAVRWLAAEVRCQRIEVVDRAALNQELGRSFRQEGEVDAALQRASEGD